ncbi:hypothetical protein PUR49_10620 [Streptomyces sp. BE147]|uniref:hypothetical protein n=1 Tax=Streptomyces sp. BE147 TaxID=3002524 RepID=UPI002E764BDE|nr:hypothetical protein [Streptomyces sp. BE147]MEE1736950.1 hypothetical protein [Streptomyces sp. BE147]
MSAARHRASPAGENGSSSVLAASARSAQTAKASPSGLRMETHPVGGTGTYTALRLTHGEDSPEIWYFDIRQGPSRLHMSYGDYLDVMLRTRGLYYWQYLFAEPDMPPGGSTSLPGRTTTP